MEKMTPAVNDPLEIETGCADVSSLFIAKSHIPWSNIPSINPGSQVFASVATRSLT